MRIVALVLFSIAVSGGGAVLAQSEPAAGERSGAAPQREAPEEVVVRGRRIGELRAEIEVARRRAYDIFNEINTNDEFDVRCRKESRPGTNVPAQTCRPRFENDVSADAAREYLSTIFRRCQPAPGGFLDTQACMFSEPGVQATANAQGVEGQALSKRDQMTEEIFRLAREDDRFALAILDFYEASQQYDAAHKRRDE